VSYIFNRNISVTTRVTEELKKNLQKTTFNIQEYGSGHAAFQLLAQQRNHYESPPSPAFFKGNLSLSVCYNCVINCLHLTSRRKPSRANKASEEPPTSSSLIPPLPEESKILLLF